MNGEKIKALGIKYMAMSYNVSQFIELAGYIWFFGSMSGSEPIWVYVQCTTWHRNIN